MKINMFIRLFIFKIVPLVLAGAMVFESVSYAMDLNSTHNLRVMLTGNADRVRQACESIIKMETGADKSKSQMIEVVNESKSWRRVGNLYLIGIGSAVIGIMGIIFSAWMYNNAGLFDSTGFNPDMVLRCGASISIWGMRVIRMVSLVKRVIPALKSLFMNKWFNEIAIGGAALGIVFLITNFADAAQIEIQNFKALDIVDKGDTLSGILHEHHIVPASANIDEVASHNNVLNPDVIEPNQKIEVIGKEISITVDKGDTLSDIRSDLIRKNLISPETSVKDIASTNHIHPDKIAEGQTIHIAGLDYKNAGSIANSARIETVINPALNNIDQQIPEKNKFDILKYSLVSGGFISLTAAGILIAGKIKEIKAFCMKIKDSGTKSLFMKNRTMHIIKKVIRDFNKANNDNIKLQAVITGSLARKTAFRYDVGNATEDLVVFIEGDYIIPQEILDKLKAQCEEGFGLDKTIIFKQAPDKDLIKYSINAIKAQLKDFNMILKLEDDRRKATLRNITLKGQGMGADEEWLFTIYVNMENIDSNDMEGSDEGAFELQERFNSFMDKELIWPKIHHVKFNILVVSKDESEKTDKSNGRTAEIHRLSSRCRSFL